MTVKTGAPDLTTALPEMADVAAIEQTILRFRLEDFDREELRSCALAILALRVSSQKKS